MSKNTAKPVTAISRTAARLSIASTATFVVLLAALHVIKPELDPSWHFISEYAIGRHGWLMVLAFLSLALGYVTLFVAIRSQIRTIVGRIGLALLLVSALGLTIAAIFTTDPITVSKDAVTTEGTLHNLGGTLGIAMPFAAALIGWKLTRNPAWSSAKQPLLWATGLALVAFLVSFVSVGVMVSQSGGEFGPEALVGWPNRFEILAYGVWLMVAAWQAIQVRDTWVPGSGQEGGPMIHTSESPSRAHRTHVPGPRGLLRRAWAFSRPLTFVGGAMLLTLAATMVGLFLDPRVITGAPAWLKPMKFAISISLYCFTLLWMLSFVRDRPRLVVLISWVTAIALFVEIALIAGAAALGTTSHFNMSTPLHAAVYATMAVSIVLVWTMNLLTAVLLLIQRMLDPAFAWSLRLGVLVSFVGMSVAFLMTSETPEQDRAAEAAGIEAPIQGAHSVGLEDGGPGMPLTGWSTTGGDLRVPHFVGLHGLQALPLIGFILTGLGPGWLRPGHRMALVWTTALSYLGLVVLLTWQALRGQPLITPDAATLGALLALAAMVGTAASAVMLHARWTIRKENSS